MPHLETLFRGNSCSGDTRIVCETTLISADEQQQLDPDLPADSFRLPIQDEIDWVDRNAIFERKESTKGNSKWANWNPISCTSQSQRFTCNLKSNSKPSIIIGLPKRHDNAPTGRRTCRPASVLDLITSSGTGPVTEPASPKVSCIGRVRPEDKEKARGRRGRTDNSAPAGKSAKRKLSFWAKVGSVFRRRRKWGTEGSGEKATPDGARQNTDVEVVDAAAPSLSELKKFQSLRRPATWASDVELDSEGRQPAAEKESSKRPFWCRRRSGPRPTITCRRDLGDVGPATA